MRVKNKKTFELSSIKKYKQYDRMLWFIPLACLLLVIIFPGGKSLFDEFIENPGIETVFGIILFLALATMILSIIPFFVGKIIIKTRLKTTIQNCTITGMQDFEYYRDKLTGLSPATISILTDLDIEQKKDVAASILQCENLGLLAENPDHTYHATEKYYSYGDLNDSDRYLIEHLQKGDFDWENDTRWKQLAMDEAISEGYVTKKSLPWERDENQQNNVVPMQNPNNLPQKKTISIKWRFFKLLLWAVWICWILNAYPRMSKLQSFLQMAPGESATEKMISLLSQPKLLLQYMETIALGISAIFIICYKPKKKSDKPKQSGSKKGCLVPLAVVLIWFFWGLSALPRMWNLGSVFETAPENASLAEQVNFLCGNPKLLLQCAEALALFIYTMFLIAYVISAFRVSTIIMKNMKSIKRTDYGNQMAECIYGMKNFIHDFSNLNAADRQQLVLWEDYLVYAVVLEENEQIVNEILKTKTSLNLQTPYFSQNTQS